MSAHAMIQEYLNLTDQLFGLVTNGRVIRLLRDSSRLIKLTYLEFDLDRIFADGLFADFALLYRLLHASRLPQSDIATSSCWLERYHQDGIEQGSRIREGLRAAVTEALMILGTGFLNHPGNVELNSQVLSSQLRPEPFFNHLLRLIYRLLFVMVIEERGLVFPAGASSRFVQIYFQHYSLQRLRKLAATRGLKVERCHDAWLSLLSSFQLFERAEQAEKLGITALGGELFHHESLGPLATCRLSNATLLTALERLCYFDDPKTGQRTPVNFGALATEEFGSVYESLLELHPQIETYPTRSFRFKQAAGNERKTSGSYYTPSSLVDCLLDSALDPVIKDRLDNFAKLGHPSAEAAILTLKVCDPACGSGHFLIAAAQRIARRLAFLRAGDEEPSPDMVRHALRETIGHCIYGVDINPMSVELCKLGLWLEAVEPGKPLTFLDHHIKCGNSLLGATPEAIKDGIPDEAYKPIEGDTKEAANWMKKLNKEAKAGGQRDLFELLESADPWDRLGNLPAAIAQLETLVDDTSEALEAKEKFYREIVEGSGYDNACLLHDAWCAVFVWPKKKIEPGTDLTTRHLRDIEANPHNLSPWRKQKIRELAEQYQFFHWHLEFPGVFVVSGERRAVRGLDNSSFRQGMPESSHREVKLLADTGLQSCGFDCILGNPPWERVNIEARQFFSTIRPDIAEAITSKRRNLLEDLEKEEPELFKAFHEAQRHAAAEISFYQSSGLYPHLNQARLNTYILFIEVILSISHERGRCGFIVPSGIATDEISRNLFSFLVSSGKLVSLFDFENRQGIFEGVHRMYKFCLLTLHGCNTCKPANLAFFLQQIDDLNDQNNIYSLSANELKLLSPISGLCPTFRTKRDRQLVIDIYERVLPFISQKLAGNGWLRSDFLIMFRSDDSTHLYKSLEDIDISEPVPSSLPRLEALCKKFLPVWEAKLLHQYDHRFSTYRGISLNERKKGNAIDVSAEQKDETWIAIPRYWVPTESVHQLLNDRGWEREWTLGYRDITNATNERTAIASCLPEGGAAQPLNLFLPESLLHACFWLAGMNSIPLDYIARQRIGGVHLNITTCRQLPVISPESVSVEWQEFIQVRTLELVFTSPALEAFARDCLILDCGQPSTNAEDGGVDRSSLLTAPQSPLANPEEGFAAYWRLYSPHSPLAADRSPNPPPPFRWDETRRFLLRCELDAAYFHLYGIDRDDVDYIMDTFPIVKRKDEAKYGEYRTKRVILEIYHAMRLAMDTGEPYQTQLDPPPADPRSCHPPRNGTDPMDLP